MNRLKLKAMLARHEGIRNKPYRDTMGKLTIGVGRNLDDVGITDDEARVLLDNDITTIESQLLRLVPCYSSLDDVRQRVLMDMAFNLGVGGLVKFQKMLAAVAARNFDAAAAEMLSSAWATQVGARATELATMMKAGAE